MQYEFWVPAIFIAIAGVALLVDFDDSDPLEPAPPEDDHDDLSLMDAPLADFAPPDLVMGKSLPGYPLAAANDPAPPDSSAT